MYFIVYFMYFNTELLLNIYCAIIVGQNDTK